jgi:hypothetical protein
MLTLPHRDQASQDATKTRGTGAWLYAERFCRDQQLELAYWPFVGAQYQLPRTFEQASTQMSSR